MFLLAAIRNTGTYLSLAMEVRLSEYVVKNDKTTSKESKYIQWNRSIDKYHNTSTWLNRRIVLWISIILLQLRSMY